MAKYGIDSEGYIYTGDCSMVTGDNLALVGCVWTTLKLNSYPECQPYLHTNSVGGNTSITVLACSR